MTELRSGHLFYEPLSQFINDFRFGVTHRVLKDLADRGDKKIQDLLFEGVKLMLQRYGQKPIA